MGIFSKKKKEELALVFDVGSSAVSGALFYMGKDGTPKIIMNVSESIILEEKVNVEKFLRNTMETLKTVSSKICLAGKGAPRRVFVVLSSPWFVSQTRVIKYTKKDSFLFTSKLANELIEKEVKIFEEEYGVKYAHTENKVKPIELKNMKTRLNGYDSANPFNQSVKEVEMNIFVSLAQEKVLNGINKAIGRHFGHENIKFSSFIIASFTVARDVFINQENFLLVNIGGEVTDISMIKKDVLRESISFPMGCNFLIRNIADKLDISLEESKTYLSLYKDGHMEETILKKVEPAITLAKNEWLKNFQEFLSKLTNDISIPSTVFVTVDPHLSLFFSDTIKNEQFNQYILTESKFRVVFLGAQALHGIVNIKEEETRDPAVIIVSIYINRFLR